MMIIIIFQDTHMLALENIRPLSLIDIPLTQVLLSGQGTGSPNPFFYIIQQKTSTTADEYNLS